MAQREPGRTKTKSKKKRPYSQASDDEKVTRNWTKALGLFKRGEYSVAILRCATCLEPAVNFAVRQELVAERELPLPFVDKLLKCSNGIHNKYQSLYLPIMEQYNEFEALNQLWKTNIVKVNRERNKVVHQGEFRSRKVAHAVMTDTYAALLYIMELHNSDEKLRPFSPNI